MKHSILIIDDEPIQAENLRKALSKERSDYAFITATSETEMLQKIENQYFNIAIIDLRMDNFKIDGFDLIYQILSVNPFTKVIIVSAYRHDYNEKLLKIAQTARLKNILDKPTSPTAYADYVAKLLKDIDEVAQEFDTNAYANEKALETLYAEAKNTTNAYQKGYKFEQFVIILFGQMGFNHIQRRVIDQSRNEVDLIIRNEINDGLLQKFKPYILVECKNTEEKVDKNQFIQFFDKLKNTSGMANLGVFITAKSMKDTAYREAMRKSNETVKVIFISNIEISRLIKSRNILEEFKVIIDEQVKDN